VTVGGFWPSLFVAAGQLSATPAAEPTAIRIEFDAPSGCSTADAFYEGVRARTDRVRWAVEEETAVQIRIRLHRTATKIRGELRLSDQEGEKETRTVDGSTCDEVVEALALTVTLALDPSALLAGKNSKPAQGGSAAEQVSVRPPAAPPARLPEPPRVSQWEISADMMAASVMSPGTSVGPALGARFITPGSGLGSWVFGVTLLHVQSDFLRGAQRGVFSLTGLELALCPMRADVNSKLDLALCAAMTGGWLRASALAVSHANTVDRSWWSVGLRGTSSMRLAGGLRVEMRIGADVPLVRREFTVNEPAEPLAESRWLAFQGALGLAYRF
jgi:hypothetical protein